MNPYSRRAHLELFRSQYDMYKDAYLNFLVVPLPDHLGSQTLLRCINDVPALRRRK